MVRTTLALLLLVSSLVACGGEEETLTVYSGRSENLIAPLLDQFADSTGIKVDVRYGSSADLALLIDQEGDRGRADVFISQSPGALGFLEGNDRLTSLDESLLALVPARWRNDDGMWIGISGRVRVIVYNEDLVDPAELPDSVFELSDDRFQGMVGLAPGNSSFQDFVTIMRDVYGDDAALDWLTDMAGNGARSYTNNTAIVQAVGRGEVPMGLVNHYYSFRALAEDPGASSRNYFFPFGNIGSVLIATGAGIVASSDHPELGGQLIEFLLGETAQRYLAEETFEYPLALGSEPVDVLPALTTIDAAFHDLDELGGGLERTKELIDASGLESP
jgi:iron(III) transport system substrate-binding protein